MAYIEGKTDSLTEVSQLVKYDCKYTYHWEKLKTVLRGR